MIRELAMMMILSLASPFGLSAHPANRGDIREPAVSGQFYPANPIHLKQAIHEFMIDALPPRVQGPIAIIAPHAGYIFSGQICADAFRQVSGNHFDVVIILGTNHTVPEFHKLAIDSSTAYRTPLGLAPVDHEIAQALLKEDSNCILRSDAHIREH